MKYLFLLSSLLSLMTLSAMGQTLSVGFEPGERYMDSSHAGAKGLDGQALDLTGVASSRLPVVIDSSVLKLTDSYSATVWVKIPVGQRDGKTIVTNSNAERKTGGFSIGSASNGSWSASLGDGKSTYTYEPTQSRQPINDGRWHMLSLVFDKAQSEARFYYDGRNVATYNTEGVDPSSIDRLLIGGTGSEWEAFNGMIDLVKCYDSPLTGDAIMAEYTKYAETDDRKSNRCGGTEPVAAESRTAVGAPLPLRTDKLRIMAFNIWHGGNETGDIVGIQRVVDIIRDSGADIVGLIETYGSGAKIADALGYYLYLHSSNLSIISRYPIIESRDMFRSFNCSAATIQISQTQRINYINLWLHYLPSTSAQIEQGLSADSIISAEWTTRAAELRAILAEADSTGFIGGDIPTFVSGDFNIDSHLDWTESTRDQHSGYVVEWPTSRLMYDAGFVDSYRELYPDPRAHPCKTWSPTWTDELQYRIDFIYYKGPKVKVRESRMIGTHPVRFPSDHAAMLSVFDLGR